MHIKLMWSFRFQLLLTDQLLQTIVHQVFLQTLEIMSVKLSIFSLFFKQDPEQLVFIGETQLYCN